MDSGGVRDGLEITVLGTLYKGPWEKKYWSSSRGKDRYPYPIGYQSVRNYAGHIYEMEIQEGAKGPVFVIVSDKGISCQGETPTIAWEKIQKKNNMRVQKFHRDQFSIIDGAEKLPTATIEGSIRRKRSRLDKKKAVCVACLDSPKLNMDCGIPAMAIENDNNKNQPSESFDIVGKTGLFVPDSLDIEENKISLNSVCVSKDANICPGILINNKGTASRPFISDQPSHLKRMEISRFGHGRTVAEIINEEPGMENHSAISNVGKGILSGSQVESYCPQQCTLLDKLQDGSMLQSSIRDCEEVLQDRKDDEGQLKVEKSNQFIPRASVIPLQSAPELSGKGQILSNECSLSSSEQNSQCNATQSLDGNLDKADSDYMGQEFAKSMIMVLLPQALPFLKQAARKKRKNISEGNLHASSIAEYDPNNQSFDQLHAVRKKNGKSSREICMVSHVDASEFAAISSSLLVGRPVSNCSLPMEAEVLCAETSTEVKTPENSCVPETIKNIVPICSSTDIKQGNFVRGISKMETTAGCPSLIKLCHDKKMYLMEANNIPEISKPGDVILGGLGIEQEHYKSVLGEIKDDVNETNGEFLIVVSSAKEKNEERDRSSISPGFDLIAKSKENCFSKTVENVVEGLEVDVPLGSRCHVNSSTDVDNFPFLIKDDKRDYVGNSRQDSVVIDYVVADSFEDDQCSNDALQKNSSHLSALVSCKMPVYDVRPLYETDPPCATNAEKKCLRRKSSLDSEIYDVKINPTLVHLLDCKGFGEASEDNAVGDSLNTEIALTEFNFERHVKYVSTAFDPYSVVLISNWGNDKQIQFEDAPCAPSISRREYMAKYDLPGQYLDNPGYQICQHEKCQSVDTGYKMVQSSALRSQYCAVDAQPGIFEVCSIGNLHEEHNGAYSIEQCLGRKFSNELLVTRSEIYVSVSCCQLTDDNGFLCRSVEGCISVDKKIDIESQAKYCGLLTNKICSYGRSSWAEAKLPVSHILCKQGCDHGLFEQALDVSVGSFQDKKVQNSDITSGMQHTILPTFSDLELASRIAIGISNHHGISDIPNAITRKENLKQDETVNVGSYCHSALIETLNKESKGISPVLTFSDVPPSTLKAEVVENNDLSAGSLLKKLKPECPSQDDIIININDYTNGNKRAMEFMELVGCYEHPIPVLSLLLSVQGKNVHLCVVCGLLQKRERILFIYKVVIVEDSSNYSCLLGYTRVILPDGEACFEIKSAFEKYGIQFTPGGHNLVLLECIRIQDLRESRVNCPRSKCISLGQCEGHGVKLVSVKNGHISVLAQLSSMESMYCILVCAPHYIIAAGENGRIRGWRMDSRWSMCVEEFILPTDGCTTAHIWELLAVPHLSHLVIGHNCNGYYSIWDISRRVMLSTFCSVDYNIFQSVVLGVVSQCACGKMSRNLTDCKHPDEVYNRHDFKDNTFNNIIPREHQESRLSSNHACSHLDFNEEYIAVCLLVLVAPPNIDKIQINQDENCDELKRKGSWRLAFLENKVLRLGDTIDARASVASVLSQNGVIGTSHGHIYSWEVMNGRKIFTLKDFEGVSISCISADPSSTAFAVAGSDNRVLLYVQMTES